MTTSSSSFSSTILVLLLCLIVSSLVSPTTSNFLSEVCIKSKNPTFCLQVLGLNPHRYPYELTEEAINLAAANAAGTTTKIDTLLNQTKDGNLTVVYTFCLNYYKSCVFVTERAGYFLKEGLYINVNTSGKLLQNFTSICENKFKEVAGYNVSTLTKDNENLGFLGSIISAAADVLSKFTSIKK